MNNLISLVFVQGQAGAGVQVCCQPVPWSLPPRSILPRPTIGSQELPWPDSPNMEGEAGNAPCEYFEANMIAQSCCQNCFHPEEAHRARHQVGWLS